MNKSKAKSINLGNVKDYLVHYKQQDVYNDIKNIETFIKAPQRQFTMLWNIKSNY